MTADTKPLARATRAHILPLRAAPEPSGSIRQILLATDLGEASAGATEYALELARALSARLLVVSVIDPGARRAGGGLRVDQERAIRETAMTELVRRARSQAVPTEFLIWTGDPRDSIVEAAAAERADLIVVGCHGRRGLERAILGSVSDHVVRTAGCPVLVVRA